MKRSDRLQPIQELAGTRERDAGALLADARRLLDERERQLNELKQYRADYAARSAPAGSSVDPVRLQNYHSFLGRLQDAIRQQEQLVLAARADCERKTAAWQERRIEAASLTRAVDNMQTAERRVDERREQRELDELALQQVMRSRDP
jgi:flagellar protein FliJ